MAFHFQREDPFGADQDVIGIPAARVEIVDDEVSFWKPLDNRACFFLRNRPALGLLGVFQDDVSLLLKLLDAEQEKSANDQRTWKTELHNRRHVPAVNEERQPY